MKKVIILLMLSVLCFTGCEKKQECDLCGEVEKCREVKEDGEIMATICDECFEDIKDFL